MDNYLHWLVLKQGERQGSILRSLLFLFHINDFSDDSSVKLFADYTSLFLVVHDVDSSGKYFQQWS